MKEYYIFLNGQEGPFTIDQLRTRNLTVETPAWYDGLGEWSTAGQIPELRNLVKVVPPPFVKHPPLPSPYHTPATSEYEYQLEMESFFAERKKTDWGTILLVSFAIGCFGLLLWFMNK